MHPIILIVALPIGLFTAYLAEKRGRNAFGWFAVGFLFGLLGLLTLYLLPTLAKDDDSEHFPSATETIPGEVVEKELPPYKKYQWYFLNKERKQQGPVPFVDLLKLWNDGAVHLRTLVWYEEMDEWKKVVDLPGFQEVLLEENKKAKGT